MIQREEDWIEVELSYDPVASEISVHLMGAAELEGISLFFRTGESGMCFLIPSPHIIWLLHISFSGIGQSSSLQLRENLEVGIQLESPMPLLPAGGRRISVICDGVELGGSYLYSLHCK